MSDAYVTYQSMDAAAAAIDGVKTQLLTLLGEVQTDVAGLGTDFATQTASSTFHADVTAFVHSLTKAINGFDSLSKFLTGGAETFEALDAKLAGIIGS